MATFELIDADGFALTDTDGFAVDSDCPGCCGTGWIVGSPCYTWPASSTLGEGVTVYMAAEDVPTCLINQCHRFEPGPGVGLDSIPEPREQLDPVDPPYVTQCCQLGTVGSGVAGTSCPPCVSAEILWYPTNECESQRFRRCCWHGPANIEWNVDYVLTDIRPGLPPGTTRTRIWRIEMAYVGTYDPTRTPVWLPTNPTVRYRFTDSENPGSNIDEMVDVVDRFAIPCSNPLGIENTIGVAPFGGTFFPTWNGDNGIDCYGFGPEPGITRVNDMRFSFGADAATSSLTGTNRLAYDGSVPGGGDPYDVTEVANINISFNGVRGCDDECDAEAPPGLYRAEGYW